MSVTRRMNPDPFLSWREGMELDSFLKFEQSATKFKIAAQGFIDLATIELELSKVYYEYSTLMDAYARIQLGRASLSSSQFDDALKKFSESSEILRSTIHFAYLAPFVSACATAETADTMESNDDERIEAYRNAIALFEQSKIALSFRDEVHSTLRKIDAYVCYCLSQALYLESLRLMEVRNSGYEEKIKRSKILRKEFEELAKTEALEAGKFCYLPLNDFERANESAFVVSYPDLNGLWLFNIGINSARIDRVANLALNGTQLKPKSSLHLDAEVIGKGKIRLVYADFVTERIFDEGCLLVI